MASYFNTGISEVSFIADEDLESWQWKMVMAASTEGYVQKHDILHTAASPRSPIGVLVNSPSLGQEASVKCIGFVKGYGLGAGVAAGTGCALQFGGLLTYANNGIFRAASDDSDDPVVGIWYGAQVTSTCIYGPVLLNFFPASGLQEKNDTN